MHRIDAMGTVIGDEAAGIIEKPAVGPHKSIPVERNLWCGTEIKIPVNSGGLRTCLACCLRPVAEIHVIPDAHKVHFSDLTALHDLLCFLEMSCRAMLRAGLHDAP